MSRSASLETSPGPSAGAADAAGDAERAPEAGVGPGSRATSSEIVPHAPSPSGQLLAASLPRRFGRYTLFEPIGRGGMPELFLARAESELGATKLAVVKLILPAFAEDPKFSEMLIHEAKLAARLSHRHIVQVLDLGRDAPRADLDSSRDATAAEPSLTEQRLYIAMEYVEGLDLNALLRRSSELGVPLPPEHALGIVVDVLEALDYAHRRTTDSGASVGLVHRDVSPSNILISYEGEVKLCDFGIAHANELVTEGKGEALKGKASYMSPEHARAEALDARADVFAAGIILWELLSGRRLYRLRGGVPLLEQARRAEIPPIADRGLPDQERLQRIVSRALAKNREDRYPTAGAFQRDLEDYLADAGLLASRLKLGDWIATMFGTSLVEQRRASERRLPKSSAPPPRTWGAVRIRTAASNVAIPAAPRLPKDLLAALASPAPSSEKMPDVDTSAPRAAPAAPKPPRAPGSLEGISMDSPPSSAKPLERSGSKAREDDELLRWARKRGWVSFLFFFLVAASIAVVWYLSR